MKIIAIIPARMGSSRFPGKPLAPLLGRPMIEHVYRRVAMSTGLSEVIVATCDDEIRSAVEGFGGRAVMTANTHERASDRIAEAAVGMDADVVVMVQGDEPMTHPDMIGEATAPFAGNPSVQCVNLSKAIGDEAEFRNPNTIKVVTDLDGRALYMSRRPVPHFPDGAYEKNRARKQVCIIPFTRDSLQHFAALAPTPLEIAESIDMMRFIEHGVPVHMVETGFESHAVDTPEDLALVEGLMAGDPLINSYI
jgi:3-deoxy-manno-octulosonate cytidylyltransferase (CMP-KDO synthetase)